MILPTKGKRMEISPAVEDYLTAVYRLEQAGLPAETKRLCVQLGGIKPGSVSGMLKRLAKAELLFYTPYQGVSLTPAGRKISLSVLRKHRLLELFLVKEMGYSWEEVHDEAENLEHHASDKFVEKIASKLGYPLFDPHGDPIPDEEGTLPARETIALADCPTSQKMRVFRLLDQNPEQLSFYGDHGLTPGSAVTISSREPGAGTITVRAAGQKLALDIRSAARILVVRDT